MINEILQWVLIIWIAYVVYDDNKITYQIKIAIDKLQEKNRAMMDEIKKYINQATNDIVHNRNTRRQKEDNSSE